MRLLSLFVLASAASLAQCVQDGNKSSGDAASRPGLSQHISFAPPPPAPEHHAAEHSLLRAAGVKAASQSHEAASGSPPHHRAYQRSPMPSRTGSLENVQVPEQAARDSEEAHKVRHMLEHLQAQIRRKRDN